MGSLGFRLYTYLSFLKTPEGIPLSYVICKTLPVGQAYVSQEERLIYQTSLIGARFVRDASRVHKIIRIESVDFLGNG